MRAITRSVPGYTRSLRFAVGAVLLTGLVAGATSAMAAEDDDSEGFEQSVIRSIMKGIGATNLDNGGIEYRERSPLVIPPSTNLRPPEEQRQSTPANWPKDPDIAEAKARRDLARRKRGAQETLEAPRVLSPSELSSQPVQGSARRDTVVPGATSTTSPAALRPSDLGYTGGFFGLFQSRSAESEKFVKEPERESLTQPPIGYQTPSSSYAYGTGGAKGEPPPQKPNIMTGR